MKIFIILACILVTAYCFDRNEWEAYKKSNGKVYKSVTEDEFRLKIYLDRKNKIATHNELYEKNLTTYMMGINQFTDMTEQEVTDVMTGYQPIEKHSGFGIQYKLKNLAVPASIDWRQYGYVTPVKNQGRCGSCYAFAVTGALEGQHYAATHRLVSLSEQQIVDCGIPYGLNGCQGGNNQRGFSYVMYNNGIDTDYYYPYRAVEGPCQYSTYHIGATCSGYYYVVNGGENDLKEIVGSFGPIAVGIDAESSFQNYKYGVYYEPNCRPNFRNHAVLVVGYGTQNGNDYWLVKNSYGTDWGEQGYIKMARNRGNNCDIASDPSWPMVP